MQTLLSVWIFLALASITAKLCDADEVLEMTPHVQVKEGLMRGVKQASLSGKTFFSYTKIPYAKPPVGNLRFKDPEPAEPWRGILDAREITPPCLQCNLFDLVKVVENGSQVVHMGSEDCLYLNIHTSEPFKHTARLPVMVFIHGGGFISGSTHESGPNALLDEDVVLVFIQYRLGVFGFLSTDDDILPGNYGLKDQQLALKWIKENIIHFGGDPDRITLYGESAGAGSVHMHILSPGSKGLFNRAIMQSGSALTTWAFSYQHRLFAEFLGNKFRCLLSEGKEAYLKCLQSVDGNDLVDFMIDNMKWGFGPSFVSPRVDGNVIPDRPEVLLKKGLYNEVDMISGITRDEGAFLALLMYEYPTMKTKIDSNFKVYMPMALNILNEQNSLKMAKQIFEEYFEKKETEMNFPEDADKFVKMMTAAFFSIGQDLSSALHLNNKNVSVFTYQLDHRGKLSLSDFFPRAPKNEWITHGDELFYIFSGGPIFSRPLSSPSDVKMRDIMVTLWTNFAKTGDPNDSKLDFKWEKATKSNFHHLSLQVNPEMKNYSKAKELKFWMALDSEQNKILKEKDIDFIFQANAAGSMRNEL